MKSTIAAICATIATALPALADGDAAAGEKEFRKCRSCHTIASPDETIVKGGRTGPDLYGIAGRTAGSAGDFRYSGLLATAGEQGLTWDEESFVGYVQDPTGWLRTQTGASGRSKMTIRMRKEEAARDLWAYLATIARAEGGN